MWKSLQLINIIIKKTEHFFYDQLFHNRNAMFVCDNEQTTITSTFIPFNILLFNRTT